MTSNDKIVGKTAHEIMLELGVPPEALSRIEEPDILNGTPREVFEQMRLEHMNYHRWGTGHCHGCRMLKVIETFTELLEQKLNATEGTTE